MPSVRPVRRSYHIGPRCANKKAVTAFRGRRLVSSDSHGLINSGIPKIKRRKFLIILKILQCFFLYCNGKQRGTKSASTWNWQRLNELLYIYVLNQSQTAYYSRNTKYFWNTPYPLSNYAFLSTFWVQIDQLVIPLSVLKNT